MYSSGPMLSSPNCWMTVRCPTSVPTPTARYLLYYLTFVDLQHVVKVLSSRHVASLFFITNHRMLVWSAINLTALHLLRRRLISFRDTTNPYFAISYSKSLQDKQMPRLIGKALADDIANTVIEDSEPERQAEEVIWMKAQRRQRREETYMKNGEAPSDAVEVVADTNNSAKPSSPKHVDPSVIEINGMAVRCLSSLKVLHVP